MMKGMWKGRVRSPNAPVKGVIACLPCTMLGSGPAGRQGDHALQNGTNNACILMREQQCEYSGSKPRVTTQGPPSC
jgi:hypothetical protein